MLKAAIKMMHPYQKYKIGQIKYLDSLSREKQRFYKISPPPKKVA